MYNFLKIKILVTALVLTSQITLTADVGQQLLSCSQIKTNVVRLGCYDEISQKLNSATTQNSSVTSENINTVQNDASTTVNSVAENLENSTVDKPEVRIVYVEKPSEPTEIHANLVGDFKGWNPNSIFTLDNGQVWRAVRSNAKTKRLPKALSNPKVTITPSAFGSLSFRVEGVRGRLKVKRVK